MTERAEAERITEQTLLAEALMAAPIAASVFDEDRRYVAVHDACASPIRITDNVGGAGLLEVPYDVEVNVLEQPRHGVERYPCLLVDVASECVRVVVL